MARAPCNHEYCRDCLQGLFTAAIQDDSLFPPKCCRQPITLPKVRIYLTSDLVRQYEAKKIEYDTLDKTYCSNASCSRFIEIDDATHDRVACEDCQQVTCTMCKGNMHMGDCPKDKSLQATLALADEQGWKRCDGCKSVIELSTGCNHIT